MSLIWGHRCMFEGKESTAACRKSTASVVQGQVGGVEGSMLWSGGEHFPLVSYRCPADGKR